MDIISRGGAIIASVDTEAGADKAMQIHSGILMTLKLSRAAKVEPPQKSAVVWEFIKARFDTSEKPADAKIRRDNKYDC